MKAKGPKELYLFLPWRKIGEANLETFSILEKIRTLKITVFYMEVYGKSNSSRHFQPAESVHLLILSCFDRIYEVVTCKFLIYHSSQMPGGSTC